MTSGVYQLTFPSGKRYIGKSIHIEERWKQHLDKMQKGKAAANMQQEYNRYGTFNGTILVECHSDHIDIIESCFISRFKPELNGVFPPDPLPELSLDDILELVKSLKVSTLEHVKYIGNLMHKIEEQEEDLKLQDAEIKELSKIRDKEELDADVDNRIKRLEKQLKSSRKMYEKLDTCYTQTYAELQKWRHMSFWQRLFA